MLRVQELQGNTGNELAQMMMLQLQLMELLGVKVPEGQDYLVSPVFKVAVDGVVTEAAEVLDSISVLTKPWKHVQPDQMRAELFTELTDVLFMVLEVYALGGYSPADIFATYLEKYTYNLERLDRVSNHADERILNLLKAARDMRSSTTVQLETK